MNKNEAKKKNDAATPVGETAAENETVPGGAESTAAEAGAGKTEANAGKTDANAGKGNAGGNPDAGKDPAAVAEKLAAAEKSLAELSDKYLRLAAEYDNFRRRTAADRQTAYADGMADTLEKILPLVDNLGRAAMYEDAEKVAKGLKMISRAATDALTSLGVEPFGAVGDTFDPNLHNAVMHVEDEGYAEGEITAVHQVGYKKGDRILRYAMVTVAN